MKPRPSRALMTSRAPVFTETYKHSTVTQNLGGNLSVQISNIAQLAQYSSLYTKYRILRATFYWLPSYVAHDENQAVVNAAGGQAWTGMGRVTYSVNDSPAVAIPVNEAQVLQDNGVKIVPMKSKLTMSCRPKPDCLDANGVRLTTGQFINFNPAGPDAVHYGISYWYTQYGGGGVSTNPVDIFRSPVHQFSYPLC
jgi:hypothetical protein